MWGGVRGGQLKTDGWIEREGWYWCYTSSLLESHPKNCPQKSPEKISGCPKQDLIHPYIQGAQRNCVRVCLWRVQGVPLPSHTSITAQFQAGRHSGTLVQLQIPGPSLSRLSAHTRSHNPHTYYYIYAYSKARDKKEGKDYYGERKMMEITSLYSHTQIHTHTQTHPHIRLSVRR